MEFRYILRFLISAVCIRGAILQNVMQQRLSHFRNSTSHHFMVNEFLEELLINCYEDHHLAIISVGDNDIMNLKSMRGIQSTRAVFLYKSLLRTKGVDHFTKIDAIIFFVNSDDALSRNLEFFLRTPWYRSKKTLFIINIFDKDCQDYDLGLEITWIYKKIAYYICFDSSEKMKIFTLNPFTTRAPDTWKFIRGVYEGVGLDDTNRLTFFARDYEKGTLCHQLDFDRTQQLNGYVLQYAQLKLNYDDDKMYEEVFYPDTFYLAKSKMLIDEEVFVDALARGLNVTLAGYISELPLNSYGHAYKYYFNNGVQLMVVKHLYGYYNSFKTLDFPICHNRYGILSHNRGFKTPLEKITEFYGLSTLLYTMFVLIATSLVVWCIKRRISFALFECLRLLITAGLETPMMSLGSRLFFTTIFIYFLIIHSTFSGNLANFLTRPEARRHVEKNSDLDSDPTIKTVEHSAVTAETLYDVRKAIYTIVDDGLVCAKTVEQNESVVCVDNYEHLYNYFKKGSPVDASKLQLSPPIYFGYEYYAVAENTFLSNRFQDFMIRFWETGIVWHALMYTYFDYEYIHGKALARAEFDHAPIMLKDLSFAFEIFEFGVALGTLSFIGEFLIYHRVIQKIKFFAVILRFFVYIGHFFAKCWSRVKNRLGFLVCPGQIIRFHSDL